MKRILYTLSFIMAIAWIAGVFIFSFGMLVHLLLILAAIAAMQALMICPRSQPDRTTS